MRTSIGTAAAVALALGLVASACTSGGSAGPSKAGEPVRLDNIKLVAYTGCDDMLTDLRRATAENVGPYGLGGNVVFDAVGRLPAEARAKADSTATATFEPSYSTTNVQEAGVDEPDLVKTDGKRLITYARGMLRVVDTASKKVTGTLRLVPAEQGYVPADLLIHGDRALVIFSDGGMIPFGAIAKRRPSPGPKYVLVDLKDLKILGAITPNGSHVDARMTGSTVRIVVRSQPTIDFPAAGPEQQQEDKLTERNRKTVLSAPIDAWLPTYQVAGPDGAERTEKVKCEQVSHPDKYSGTSMLTVHTIDLEAGLDGDDPIAVAADGDTVYGTPTSLYVTSNPHWWSYRAIDVRPLDDTVGPGEAEASPSATPSATAVAPKDPPSSSPAEKVEPSDEPTTQSPPADPSATPSSSPSATPSSDGSVTPVPPSTTESTPSVDKAPPEETEVHRFDITGGGAPKYVASGLVPGRLLNQYSLSEYDGNLRIATTSSGSGEMITSQNSSSAVYVLNSATLAKVGEVTGLGKGERIYSVRFIGPVGYVVTFKQVDPLYTLDLRDPAQPKVTGELKITGYSAYLHPAGDGRLIGIGQEASAKGRTLGTQLSLFDVRDPAKPALLARFHQKDSGSEAEWDPHAFLYWPESGLAVVPVNSWGPRPDDSRSAAMVLKIGDGAITKTGLISHPKTSTKNDLMPSDPSIRRCVVIGGTLWTVSYNGIKASDAGTLADQAWIPFAS
ncbi:beta-propeller domain-containing protein [Sphaerisporangium fuscum]|uniref:beta-propeller domain-containing protein n=1 Tax=Sphaerisporangium fuscum TaxID=2835868 RepID=UPI001BDC61B8|nr:beta-propeller domain-containing protein [Sphaerisporangium fuscum]